MHVIPKWDILVNIYNSFWLPRDMKTKRAYIYDKTNAQIGIQTYIPANQPTDLPTYLYAHIHIFIYYIQRNTHMHTRAKHKVLLAKVMLAAFSEAR